MAESQWYWCLTHNTVEQGEVCRAANRMGPYPTKEAARNWKTSHEDRQETWEEEDERWESWEE